MQNEERKLQQRPTCHGYVCLYSCVRQFQNNLGPLQLEPWKIPYHYEVYTNIATTNLSAELLRVESLILSTLSNELKLDTCDFNFDNSQVTFDTDDYGWLFPDAKLNNEIIASVASSPMDIIDTENPNCISDSSEAPIGTTCIPIKGKIRIRYGSKSGGVISKQNIGKSILNLIDRGMSEDMYVTESIVKLVNIADTTALTESLISSSTDIDDNQIGLDPKSTTSGFSIGVSMIVVTVLVIVSTVVFGISILRKMRNEKKEIKEAVASPCFNDVETVLPSINLQSHENDDSRDSSYDDDEDDQHVVSNPAMERYDLRNGAFPTNNDTVDLSTISEGSIETDDSSVSSQRILSESTYDEKL